MRGSAARSVCRPPSSALQPSIGVFLADVLLENVLIQQALRDEASFLGAARRRSSHPLPATLNLTGYLEDAPAELALLAPDSTANGEARPTVVYVTENAGRQLTLVFDRGGVAKLVALFGLLPLAFVLLVLYLTTWLAFALLAARSRRSSRSHAGTPSSIQTAPIPARFDRSRLPPAADDVGGDRRLGGTLGAYSDRLVAGFVARERQISREMPATTAQP